MENRGETMTAAEILKELRREVEVLRGIHRCMPNEPKWLADRHDGAACVIDRLETFITEKENANG